MGALYQLFTLIILALGCLIGVRRGLTGQLGSLIGSIFGIGAAGILWRKVAMAITEIFPFLASELPMTMYLPDVLASALLFFLCYLIFITLGPALRLIMQSLGVGILNKIMGGIWGLFKMSLILSFIYNIIIGIDHNSPLMQSAMNGDGNLSTGVLLLAPAITGVPDCDELAFRIQLHEAKKFDVNHSFRPSVNK